MRSGPSTIHVPGPNPHVRRLRVNLPRAPASEIGRAPRVRDSGRAASPRHTAAKRRHPSCGRETGVWKPLHCDADPGPRQQRRRGPPTAGPISTRVSHSRPCHPGGGRPSTRRPRGGRPGWLAASRARLTVHRNRGALEARRVGHIAHHVVCLQLEGVGRALGGTAAERGKELVDLPLARGVAPSTQDSDGLVAGQSARRRAASPLCSASSASCTVLSTHARNSSRSVIPSASPLAWGLHTARRRSATAITAMPRTIVLRPGTPSSSDGRPRVRAPGQP
jgi:hypothetical protein